jgi:hypothetical protein
MSLLLGVLAAAGLAGYAVLYVVAMPSVGPDAFVPKAGQAPPAVAPIFGWLQGGSVLLYAMAFLPLTVLFTIRRHDDHPAGTAVAGSFLGLSLLVQLLNSLPSLGLALHPVSARGVPPELALYLKQVEAVRFLALDVTGFTLAYAAGFIYGLVYWRRRPILGRAMIASIVLFVANVPFLWWMPNMAIILMSASVLVFAALPLTLARMAGEPARVIVSHRATGDSF